MAETVAGIGSPTASWPVRRPACCRVRQPVVVRPLAEGVPVRGDPGPPSGADGRSRAAVFPGRLRPRADREYRSPDHRFEVDSANAAQDFLRALGIDRSTAGVVWDAIALHTTPEIPWHKRPEIALVTGGVEADVLGDGLGEIPDGDRDAVLAAYPRIEFKRGIVRAFSDGFAHKPGTTFGTMNTDVLERTLSGYRRRTSGPVAANPLEDERHRRYQTLTGASSPAARRATWNCTKVR